MKRLVFLSVVTFCLGIVTACEEEARTMCIQRQKKYAEQSNKVPNKCAYIDYVSICVLDIPGCTVDDANNARNELLKQLNLDCDNLKEISEDTCGGLSTECERKLINSDRKPNCEDIEEYENCLHLGIGNITSEDNGQVCRPAFISNRLAKFVMQTHLKWCAALSPFHDMCMDLTAMEKCVATFSGAVAVLGLKQHPETYCRLLDGFRRCVEKNGQCVPQTTQAILRRMTPDSIDCSEYVDVCIRTNEVNCSSNYASSKKEKCEKLKDLKECLHNDGHCSYDRIHVTMRRVMDDESFDCPDVNGCSLAKHETCMRHYSYVYLKNEDKDKDVICNIFKEFKSCMAGAQCNNLYLNSVVARVQKTFKNPCDAASTILASIGLTLLLAIFTSLWK